MSIFEDDLKRLNLEDLLFVVIIILAFANIFGDSLQKEYVKNKSMKQLKESDEVFIFTLFITLIIYLYYLIRNYYFYNKAQDKEKQIYGIKFIGSLLLVVGIIFLLYFQTHDPNFIGSPA